MMYQNSLLIAILTFLASCAYTPETLKLDNTEETAKIRVFAGSLVYLHSGYTCYSDLNKNKIKARQGVLRGVTSKKEVGMPKTDDVPIIYDEHIIPANKLLTIAIYNPEYSGSCFRSGVSFTPQVGSFYDVKTIFHRWDCDIRVREIIQDNAGKVYTKSVGTVAAEKCP